MRRAHLFFLFLMFVITESVSENLSDLNFLQSQWVIVKNKTLVNQKEDLNKLAKIATQLVLNHPKEPEYLIWEAKIYTLIVESSSKFKAVNYAKHARNSLKEALLLSSDEQLGYIYSNLGYLYLVSPELSLSFKSDLKEENYFLKGVKLNPVGLESNYYYGLFLLKNNRKELAHKYLSAALESSESDLPIKAILLLKKEITEVLHGINSKHY